MKVLVINAGSSSLKYQLINVDNGEVIAKGLCERIGIEGSMLTYKPEGKGKFEFKQDMKDHTDAIRMVLDALVDPEIGVVKSMDEIDAVGHRLVHGGEKFNKSVIITDELIKEMEVLTPLAPLHNPANLMGVRACQAIMPNTPMVGVFDTAFHQTMPPKAFLYGLPYEAYKEHMVRRYGFHGTSHMYVSQRALTKLDMPKEDTRIITCHLGNGSSISAIKGGKCVDTSMGLTPLEGVPMGTRCGDIDPAIIEFLMKKENMDIEQMNAYLNKKSGVMGISGVSSDFRDISAAWRAGDERAKLALDVFCYHVKKYIGSYAAVMNGVDAVVFTAGVGENTPHIRSMIMENMQYLGFEIDEEKNKNGKGAFEFTTENSRVKGLVIPTNEELVIARDTLSLCS